MKSGIVLATAFACIAVLAPEAGAIGDDAAREAPDETRAAATADTANGGSDEFVPPPGFVRKKRGNHVLYCKRDTTVGTRIKTENCYDEQQVRDYMLALKETKDGVDRIRNSCANICLCGAPEACNPNIREPRR